MNRLRPTIRLLYAVVVTVAIGAAAFITRGYWQPYLPQLVDTASDKGHPRSDAVGANGKVLLTDQAIANLGLRAKSVQPQTYWKSIQVPGMVVDRPGYSDRNVVSPVTGVLAKINFVPGDTVRPGDALFSIRLSGDVIHQTQSELFKTIQDVRLAKAQRKRLESAGGAVPESRLIEIDNQLNRLDVTAQSLRRELTNSGLTSEQIDAVAEGKFVNEIKIHVPERALDVTPPAASSANESDALSEAQQAALEMQELKVELGQQVQFGQSLCLLANHRMLAIEGRAFRDEGPLLERTVKEKWAVEVDFQEDASANWPPLNREFFIRYIANTIDPVNRTFAFHMPLENESRVVSEDGPRQLSWRFRPGQKLRIQVPIERLDNVFVLPADAVTRDGAEAYLFIQNVNTFERVSVRTLAQDRTRVAVANDGALIPSSFVCQTAAAQLNRMAKSQSSSGPVGYHVHADGSLHKNGEEEK